ncbi:cytokinin dehydrogenase 3-like [Nymphaea colorata]|nr:cytokinin dehydrogenase 3-like [Nymphaea colorata]
MEFAFLLNHINVLLLLVMLCVPCGFIQCPTDFGVSNILQATPSASVDFGRMYFNLPAAVLRPKSPREISFLLKSVRSSSPFSNRVTVAARGAGHSINGQAQALDGIVIEMDSLPDHIEIHSNSEEYGCSYADVSGGTLWIDLLRESLKVGLAPRSWTDYLYLTIGGTLSNGGISGQTFKHGPQVANVLQLDVVTGQGELLTCSKAQNSELFYAVLGGLGQFGIITRARIVLEEAPHKVKWVRVFYDEFEKFTRDQELLVTAMEGMVDYVEGLTFLNQHSLLSSFAAFPSDPDLLPGLHGESNTSIYYCIEFAVHCHHKKASNVQKATMEEEVVRRLNHIRSLVQRAEVSYFDFLNRVGMEEEKLRSKGAWDVPHPWLNLFVPSFSITTFKDLLLQNISPTTFEGPLLIYPIRPDKWDANMSVVLPRAHAGKRNDSLIYVVGVLRSAPPECVPETPCLNRIEQQNRRIVETATRWLSAKQYLPAYSRRRQWEEHFGESGWLRFQARKAQFDPLNVLAPGQRIFSRWEADSKKNNR